MRLKDKFKTMTDEEMIEFFSLFDSEVIGDLYCGRMCPHKKDCPVDKTDKCYGNDSEVYKWLLEQEYDEIMKILKSEEI